MNNEDRKPQFVFLCHADRLPCQGITGCAKTCRWHGHHEVVTKCNDRKKNVVKKS